MNVADPLSRHPALEVTTALEQHHTGLSSLTLSSADGAMLSAVVARRHHLVPLLNTQAQTCLTALAAQHTHTGTDMPDSTAAAA